MHRRSEPQGFHATISARYDWSVARQLITFPLRQSYLTTGMLSYNRNVILHKDDDRLSITRDIFRLNSTFARLYNAAASPASRLRSAASLAIKFALV